MSTIPVSALVIMFISHKHTSQKFGVNQLVTVMVAEAPLLLTWSSLRSYSAPPPADCCVI